MAKKVASEIPVKALKTPRSDRERRIRQSDRIARVLKVLALIQSRGRWNAKAIAEQLECSERTVHRDLEVLSFVGVPWHFEPVEQCYRVRSDFRFPTLTMTPEEAVGQTLATVLTQTPGLDVNVGAAPVTRKLAATTAEETQEILADSARILESYDLKFVSHQQHQGILKTIQMALLKRKMVSGAYASPYEAGPVELTLHPYRLCLVKRAWYLIARIDEEDQAKTFRVARFENLCSLEQAAEVPENFDMRTHFGNAWAVYRGDQEYRVRLRFEPQTAQIVSETAWHHTQKIQQHQDGSATFTFTVDGLEEILNWLLRWTGNVTILEPEDLKQRFREKLQTGLKENS